MTNSQTIGSRFENATLELFKIVFPLIGFDLVEETLRCSGSQSGFDIFFKARPASTTDINVNFFIECKSAKSINLLHPHEFEGKPEQLNKSLFNPDYWILFSPLRYPGNDLQEFLDQYGGQYPFAFVNWAREGKFENKAGLYLDLFKHFPEIYNLFKADIPDNIRDIPAEYSLEHILDHLRNSIRYAYDEFQERVVHKGILPGVRRITSYSVHNSRETNDNKLVKIRENYFKLNSSDRYIWKVVCNNLDVRNERLDNQINSTLNKVDSGIASIWILGAPGCGKTTQMNRTAVDFALKGFPVILINALNLDENLGIVDYEDYFKKVYHLHNAGLDSSDYKTLLIFIDNPTAKLEHISNILRYFDDYYENFRCIFLLFERETRRHEVEEEDYLLDLVGGDSQKIYINNRDMIFKERVCHSFIQALGLTGFDLGLARDAYFDNPDISLAEAVINFCKRSSNSRYKSFIMDWVDFDSVISTLRLLSLSDMYKWVSVIYQFGLAIPVSLLKKVMANFDESEYYNFQDFFNSADYENLPLILEGNTVRTRHELLAEWYIEEKLKPTIHQRLISILNAIDIDDMYERSIFNSLLRRKAIVRKYFTALNKNELESIQQKAAGRSATNRNVMMMIGWLEYQKDNFAVAKDIFKSVMDSHPTFLPAILETGKMEFLLGKYPDAERVLKEYLELDPKGLHPRTELAKVYQAQKQYPDAERVLNDLLELDPKNLQARTELAKVYQVQKKYPDAERVLKECLDISPNDLDSRTELAKVYQAQGKYPDAEKVLKECLDISPNDLDSRTELAKVYQAQKKYSDAEKVLNDLLKLDPQNLYAHNELAKVYQAQEKYLEAEKVLKECLDISPNDLDSRTELAKVYQAQKKYSDAEKVLNDLLKLDPQNLYAHNELAKVYQAQKKYSDAEKVLNDLLKLDPQNLYAHNELAKVYQAQEKYLEAEKVLKECLDISPNDLDSRTELAKVYQAQKKYSDAEKVLNDLLKLDPQNLYAHNELAKVYQAQEKYLEAEKVLNDLLKLDPQNLHAHNELAKVYQAQEKYLEAEKVLNDLLKLDPQNLYAHNGLAKVYQAQEKYLEAEKVLNDLLKLDPQNLHAHNELAKVYQAQEKYLEAEKVLNDLLKLDPQNLHAHNELAKVYQAQEKYLEAEKVLNDLLKLDPQNLYAHNGLAKVYQAQEKYLEAEKVLNDLLKLDPQNLYAHNGLAKVYQAQKKYPEAEKVLNDLLKLDPQNLYAHNELAKVYQAQEKYPEAEKVLNDLLKLDPQNLYAHNGLAKVYQAQEKYPEAEKVLNDLLKLDPKDIHAHNELARIYITLSLFRRAKEVISTYIRTNQRQFGRVGEYLILTNLNACSKMGRYPEGVEFVDKLGCHLFSPQVAEEYGRLLRSYDLTSAVTFFEKASEKFNRSGRLLSEVAVCFKLAGRLDAKDFLEKAIRLNPYKGEKYRSFFDNPPIKKPLYLRTKDGVGHQITDIDYETESGIIESQGATHRFRSSKFTKELFRKLKIDDPVFFDITNRNYAVNVEPYFSSSVK